MRKRFFLILFLLAVTAFAIRMAVSVELYNFNDGNNPVVSPSPLTDMGVYKSNSDLIARGEYKGEFYFQPFYYAVFLPLIKIIFGNSTWMIIVCQSLVGALTVFLAGLCSAKLWSKNSGIITAGLLTFSNGLILYTPFQLIETLQTFFLVLIFYTVVMAIQRRNWVRWSLVGFALGCSILTRGNVWIFFPALFLAAIFCQFNRREDRINLNGWRVLRKLMPAVVFIIFTFLPQLPFVAYNSRVRGKLSPPSTAAQNVLALGNTPEAPPGGREWEAGPGQMEYPKTFQLWTHDPNKSVQQYMWEWFNEEPLAFLELTFRKFLLFWDYREIPNNISFEYGELSNTFVVLAHVYAWILITLGVSGMFCLHRWIRKKLELQVLFYMVLSYALSIVAFYILARFRIPVLPLLGIFAGMFACHFWEIRKKSFERAYYFCFPVVFVIFCIVFFSYDFYRYHCETDVVSFVRPDGVRVRILPDKEMVLDSGPYTFGGWNLVAFRLNTPLVKTFSKIEGRGFKSVEFEIPIIWETPGEATISVNGVTRKLSNSQSGMMEYKINLDCPKDGKFDIRVLEATTRIFYYIDVQRFYKRTMIGDFQPPGEVVCRAYFSTKPLQNVIPESRREQKEQNRGLEEEPSNDDNLAMINVRPLPDIGSRAFNLFARR